MYQLWRGILYGALKFSDGDFPAEGEDIGVWKYCTLTKDKEARKKYNASGKDKDCRSTDGNSDIYGTPLSSRFESFAQS